MTESTYLLSIGITAFGAGICADTGSSTSGCFGDLRFVLVNTWSYLALDFFKRFVIFTYIDLVPVFLVAILINIIKIIAIVESIVTDGSYRTWDRQFSKTLAAVAHA